jgi:hypothetical protein
MPMMTKNNNINLFAQEADLRPEMKKKSYNVGQKDVVISNFEYQKGFEEDDLLKETPKNQEIKVTSF